MWKRSDFIWIIRVIRVITIRDIRRVFKLDTMGGLLANESGGLWDWGSQTEDWGHTQSFQTGYQAGVGMGPLLLYYVCIGV